MMRKLTPWLVVALVAGAFAVGMLGGAHFWGGSGGTRATSRGPTASPPATTSPTPPETATARVPSSSVHARSSTRAKGAAKAPPSTSAPSPTSAGAGGTPPNSPATAPTPEPNPLAVRTPATASVPGVPTASGPGPAASAAAPATSTPPDTPAGEGKPSVPGELVEVDSSARQAMAEQALLLLRGAEIPTGNEGLPSRDLLRVQELCVELVHTVQPGGTFGGCEAK